MGGAVYWGQPAPQERGTAEAVPTAGADPEVYRGTRRQIPFLL